MDEGSKSLGSRESADGSAMVCGTCGPLCCFGVNEDGVLVLEVHVAS